MSQINCDCGADRTGPSAESHSETCSFNQICKLCHHSLRDNSHGFDQNDAYMDGDNLIHSGRCTYCLECNPRLKELRNDRRTKS